MKLYTDNMYRASVDASSVAVMLEKLGSIELFLQNTIRDCICLCTYLSPFKFIHRHSNACIACLSWNCAVLFHSLRSMIQLDCLAEFLTWNNTITMCHCRANFWVGKDSALIASIVIILWKVCKCMVVFRTWHRNVIE
jgi:hypothetical protein